MTRRVRLPAVARVAPLVGLVVSARLGAQTLRGTIRDPANRSLPGVLVLMLDSASNVAARALTNERGEFVTASARAGTYRVRMMHIGFQPELTEPVTLLSGGEVTKTFAYTSARVALDTVRVVDRGSCQSMGDSAAITFRVWEQALTALGATQVTAASRTLIATTIAYDRVLEPDLRHVRQQRSSVSTALVTQPWRVVSADSLHRAGFVVTDRANMVTYHAPGIDVLLSPTFVADHCFQLVPPGRGHEQFMGIAFEPTPERKRLPEIRGTLWLDRKSAALQRLDFRYVHLSREQEQLGGGELEFADMRNGAWAISRWSIRMPVLEQTIASQEMGGVQTHVVEVHVTGGELALAMIAASHDTIWTGRTLTVAGTVADSASARDVRIAGDTRIVRADLVPDRGSAGVAALAGVVLVDSTKQPIPRVEVTIVDLSKTLITDERGAFRFADIPPGTHHLVARHVGYGVLDASVDAPANETTERTLFLPRAVALDSVVVNAASRDPGMRDFEEHRRVGLGRFLTRTELAPMDNLTLVDALTSLRGIGIARGRMGHGWAISKRSLPSACGTTTGMSPDCIALLKSEGYYVPRPGDIDSDVRPGCYSQIYINGTLVNSGYPTEPFDLGTIPTRSIEAIEIYAEDSEVPMRYASHGSKCGVIVLHTRR